jgi:TolB-like protein/class 3 adenylate cyclase/Tfp pilus assembly protein PilF
VAEEKVTRKLTTILSADVEAYTRLMRADEEVTLKTLKSYREIIDGLIGKHDGRIFGTGGDSVIAEFGSAVEAVRCAITIQEELRIRNAELAEERQMKFRIGVNVGDVMVEDDNLYGDGVNVAARLEGMAEAGGICISGSTFDQVKNKLSIGFEDIGAQEVKNITEPVPAFRVVPGPGSIAGTTATPTVTRRWRIPAIAVVVAVLVAIVGGALWWQPWVPEFEPASVERMAYPLPDKSSIAVLPFENFSGEKQDNFIARGLTEDIITALSKLPQMFVISRTSSFAFKEKTVTAKEIAEELGVRYLLEGSIQRSGETLRVSAQLIDAVKGHHLWAENFDGEAKDLFALQDEIVRRILVELQVKLTAGDHARVASRGTNNLDAWLLREQAMAELYKFTRESTIRTRELLQRAHEADPSWGRALGGLAFTYWYEARRGWTDDREKWIRKGIELAEQAIAMDPKDTLGYMQLGNLYQLKGNHGRAIELREKAVEIAPNDFQANWGLGGVLFKAGQAERAVEVLKHAERQSPRHPASFTWTLSEAELLAGQYEDAIETAKRASVRAPDRSPPRIHLAAAYSALGRMEEAESEATEVLRIDPKFTVSGWKRQQIDYRDRAAVDKIASLLVEAGLPE